MKNYVLDTNIILNDVNNIFKISQSGENRIILPETVIDELDAKKSNSEEIGFQAREFGRIIAEGTIYEVKNNDDSIITSFTLRQGVKLDIVSLHNYESEKKRGIDKSSLNDRKIIEVAVFVDKKYKETDSKSETIFLSIDVMCYIKAISTGLKAESLTYKNKDKKINFIKYLNVDKFPENGSLITEIDSDYKFENYCYVFKYGNQVKLGYIINKVIKIVNETEMKKGDVKPRNQEQHFAMAGMLDKDLQVVLIEAIAGSGKTLLAVSAGMRCINKKQFDKIIYIRNSVESLDKGEEIGFLSGNEEKLAIYNYPLFDTLDFIVRTKKIKKKDTEEDIKKKIEDLVSKYNIETMWIGGIRGRTITNAYVIIDEIQNFSRKSLQTVLSRLDDNCKVICIGSNRQIDNIFVNKHTNGLSLLLDKLHEDNEEVNVFATQLHEVVRGKITEWAENTFS